MRNYVLSVLVVVVVFVACTGKENTTIDMKNITRVPIDIRTNAHCFVQGEFTENGFIKTAVIFKDEKKPIIFFEIKGTVITDIKNHSLIDGKQYGEDFYAWKIEVVENGFYLHPFWNKGKSTTDPIIFYFNEKRGMFEKFRVPVSEY